MSVKITQFEAENVKRIKALTLTPAPTGLTVIGGRNNQGKTSGLDAIVWALGGDRYRPSQAQREGSVLPPRLRLELSNGIIVERSGKNSDLKVTDASGRKAGQQLLNSFVEQLALDMPRFMQSSSKEKASTLLRLIGLEEEIAALDRQEKELYNQRHTIGQIADQKAKYAKELPNYPEAPAEPVSAYDLIQRQQDILARNGENQRNSEFVSAELKRSVTYTIEGFCVHVGIARSIFYSTYGEDEKFSDIVTRMREECEVDARMKFELGVIDTKLAPLWMSRHGYSTKQENSHAEDQDALGSFLKAIRPTREDVEALYAKEDE